MEELTQRRSCCLRDWPWPAMQLRTALGGIYFRRPEAGHAGGAGNDPELTERCGALPQLLSAFCGRATIWSPWSCWGARNCCPGKNLDLLRAG